MTDMKTKAFFAICVGLVIITAYPAFASVVSNPDNLIVNSPQTNLPKLSPKNLPQNSTQLLSLNHKSLPANSYKVASVCALGNDECGLGLAFSNTGNETNSGAKKCKAEGYTVTSCAAPKKLGARCKYHPSYFASCSCETTVSLASNEYCTEFCDTSCMSKATCPANQIHTANLSGCYQPSCSEGGYLASVPTNNKCSSTSYYGRTCYHSCYQPGCSEGGYLASIPSNNRCSSTSYYGNTCYYSCYQPGCSEGGYQASVPSGQACTTNYYYGRTCYSACYQLCTHSCTGQTTPCDSNQVQTSSCNGCGTMYYSCRAKTCSDGGYYSSSMAGYNCNSVMYLGKYCYTCTPIPCYNRPVTRYCNGGTYCCGSGATSMSCDYVVTGLGGCNRK